MDPEIFYAVVDGQLQRVETRRSLPASFLNAVPTNIAAILDTPAMTIGGWEDNADGPLALALDANGELTAVIAVNDDQVDSMGETLQSIDTWLSSMHLRDLSELSGNHVVFYEGLWDLSPNSSIALVPTRHYVLLTALEALPTTEWSALLPNARFSVRHFDAVSAPGHPALVRRRATAQDQTIAPPPLVAVPEPGPAATPLEIVTLEEDATAEHPHLESVQDLPSSPVVDFSPVEIPRINIVPPADIPGDIVPLEPQPFQDTNGPDAVEFSVAPQPDEVDIEGDVVDLIASDANTTINLDDPLVNGLVNDLDAALAPQALIPGSTYSLSGLPLLFDATGETLISISDELFAVDDDVVLVVQLPERRRDTPFEERDRFRWDTSLDRVQLLNDQSMNTRGERRTVHLFVESDRQPEYAAYVGVLDRTAFQTQTESETAWFAIEPRLDSDLHRLLKRGRLPQHDEQHVN